jgi:hypothetical protein
LWCFWEPRNYREHGQNFLHLHLWFLWGILGKCVSTLHHQIQALWNPLESSLGGQVARIISPYSSLKSCRTNSCTKHFRSISLHMPITLGYLVLQHMLYPTTHNMSYSITQNMSFSVSQNMSFSVSQNMSYSVTQILYPDHTLYYMYNVRSTGLQLE